MQTSKLIPKGSAKFFVYSNGDTKVEYTGNLTEKEIEKIRIFIKDNYQFMYLTWKEYSDNSYYGE